MPDVNPLPVSGETRESLQAVRDEDQSYDDVLAELVEDHYELALVYRLCRVEALDADDLDRIDDE